MRSTSITLLAAAFVLACADAPTSTLLEPEAPSMALGKAPPPWALIEGEVTTDGSGEVALASISFSLSATDGAAVMSHGVGSTATYQAWLLVTPGNQAKLLRFVNDPNKTATFSNGAMITKINGKVSGRGTMTVSGHTYELSAVTQFEADGECATSAYNYSGPPCATFSAGDGSFSSAGSVWTGILSNDGGGGFDLPPGWDGCGITVDCVCVNCEIIGSYSGKGGRR